MTPDGCIDTLCTTTDIENLIRLEQERVLIYPNPTRSDLQIRLSKEVALPMMVKLYDMQGQQLLAASINEYEASMNISILPNGQYLVVTENNGLIISTETIVKVE